MFLYARAPDFPMSSTLIAFFGSAQLAQGFLYLSVMTAPCWLLMLIVPGHPWVQRLVSPFGLPLVLIGVQLYLYFLFFTMRVPVASGVEYHQVKGFFSHPIAFLCFWCQLQLLNLFLGSFMFERATRYGLRIPAELLLCWLTGPISLIPFSIRLAFIKTFR